MAVVMVPRTLQFELLTFFFDDAATFLIIILKPTNLNATVEIASRSLEWTQLPTIDALSQALEFNPIYTLSHPMTCLHHHVVELFPPLFNSVYMIDFLQFHYLFHLMLQISPSSVIKHISFRCSEQTFTFDDNQSRSNRPVLFLHDEGYQVN